MKVAYFTPMPPETSGIADYSALLAARAWRQRVELDVVQRGRKRPPRGADVCLYHVGNDPDAHGWIVDALRRRPGVVVLHDFVLHHLVAGITLGRRDGHGYLDAMERDGGVAGAAARTRASSRSGSRRSGRTAPERFPARAARCSRSPRV